MIVIINNLDRDKYRQVVDRRMTAAYLIKALKEIRENPLTHKYSAEEVDELHKIESQVSEDFDKLKQSPAIIEARRLDEEMQNWRREMPQKNHTFFSQMKHITALGWFISPHIIRDLSLPEFAELVRERNVRKFEEKVIELANEFIPRILSKCSKQFPVRKKIFTEIQTAFNAKLYSAVISLCYSQADGISNDVRGFGFFDKSRNEDYHLRTYLTLKQKEIGINTGIAEQLGIMSNEMIVHEGDDRLQDSIYRQSSFNRHLVVHGHSVEYGSRVNAIRAIYLLDFLSYFSKAENESVYE